MNHFYNQQCIHFHFCNLWNNLVGLYIKKNKKAKENYENQDVQAAWLHEQSGQEMAGGIHIGINY